MSRKLLQIAGSAVVLAACGIFFLQERELSRSRLASPPERATQPQTDRSTPTTIEATGSDASSLTAHHSSQWLDEALQQLPTLPASERDAFVAKLIKRLREAGPPGLRAVAEFLRSGKDVPIREGYGLTGNTVALPSSLRIALLDALANWEGSASVLLDFLRSPASVWEMILAIRNLELQFPSTYRAESIAALKSTLTLPPKADFGNGGDVHLFATVARLEAKDLLPLVEKLAVETSNVPRYVEMLSAMPAETRVQALQSVLARHEVAEEIEAAPQTLQWWSFSEPQVRAYVGGILRNRLAPEQRVAALDSLEATPPMLPSEQSLFSTRQNARESDRAAAAAAIREAEARKTFLSEVANDKSQPPEVEAAAVDAKKRITADLAARQTAERAETNPLVEVDFAQGEGRAQIKGKRIEAIELLAPAVVQPAPSPDSTDSPDR